MGVGADPIGRDLRRPHDAVGTEGGDISVGPVATGPFGFVANRLGLSRSPLVSLRACRQPPMSLFGSQMATHARRTPVNRHERLSTMNPITTGGFEQR